MLKTLFLLSLAHLGISMPTSPNRLNNFRKLASRDGASTKASDPFDYGWITHFSAVGDSYSAGIGAGHYLIGGGGVQLNKDCYQYSYGYPNTLYDIYLGDNSGRQFQWTACSGAKMNDIKDKQVPSLSKSQAITLSAGGNDAWLADILNYCVYRWATWWPFYDCNGELDRGRNTVKGDQFYKDMQDLLKAVEGQLADDNSRIYYVGYAKFFDDSTADCDKVTWTFRGATPEYLTQDRRRQFNELTDMVNDMIIKACGEVDRCVYVDIDEAVGEFGGRFCEPGVNENYNGNGGVESPTDGWNREQTVFYEWDTTKDNDLPEEGSEHPLNPPKAATAEQRSIKRLDRRDQLDNKKLNNETFEGRIRWYVEEGIKNKTLDAKALKLGDGDVTAEGLPDWISRMFHLTKFGNQIVASNIAAAMVTEQEKMFNQKADVLDIDLASCPIDVAPAPASTAPPPPPPGPTAPYTSTGGHDDGTKDKCHLHVKQYWSCDPKASHKDDLSAEVDIWDAAGTQIGHADEALCGDQNPLSVKSKLEQQVVLHAEHQKGNYIQFDIGEQRFTSKDGDQGQPAWCTTGEWDVGGKGGPACGIDSESVHASKREMDCYFQCPWGGGKSSDAP